MSLDWFMHWSLKEHNPRSSQVRLINQISNAIDKGFKNIILEAGTGIGKSAIATTIADMHEDSYILTMTKQLQKQYLIDFNEMLVEIKGRGNYDCNYDGTCEFCIKAEYNIKKCSDCQFSLAFKNAVDDEKIYKLKLKSKNGDADAQYQLALYYYYSLDQCPKGLSYLEKSARKGNEYAQNLINYLYNIKFTHAK